MALPRISTFGALVVGVAGLASCDGRSSRATSPADTTGAPGATGPVGPVVTASPSTAASSSSARLIGSPGCGKPPAKTGIITGEHVTVSARDRTYGMFVPPSYAPDKAYALVVALHGSGGKGENARTELTLDRITDGRAVVLYPDGAGGEWDLDGETASNRDVALFDMLLFTVSNALCLDMKRVFVTGFSNGAYMANQLACKRGDRIRAIATHAGGGPFEVRGSYDERGHLLCPGRPVATLVIHGLADTSVMPSEGQNSVEHWLYANRCSRATAPTTLVSPALALPNACVAYEGCTQPVVACRVPGLGHAVWAKGRESAWTFFEAIH